MESLEEHMYSYLQSRYPQQPRRFIIEIATRWAGGGSCPPTTPTHSHTHAHRVEAYSEVYTPSAIYPHPPLVPSIIRSMYLHMDKDNEVQLFALIFRKELSPSFRHAQARLKAQIPSLIRTFREAKARATRGTAPSLLSRAHVAVDEANYVVRYLFSPREAETLVELLKTLVESTKQLVPPTQAEAVPAADGQGQGIVMHSTLVELILDFQVWFFVGGWEWGSTSRDDAPPAPEGVAAGTALHQPLPRCAGREGPRGPTESQGPHAFPRQAASA